MNDGDAADREAAPSQKVGRSAESEGVRQWQRVVGLKYVPAEGLPQVILKGVGPLAEEVLQRGRLRPGAKIVKNAALLQSLYRLPVEAHIGPELFHVVAVLLAHVFALEAKMKGDAGD